MGGRAAQQESQLLTRFHAAVLSSDEGSSDPDETSTSRGALPFLLFDPSVSGYSPSNDVKLIDLQQSEASFGSFQVTDRFRQEILIFYGTIRNIQNTDSQHEQI
jgi:hypothetical protein